MMNLELLKLLMTTPGVSGCESPVREVVADQFARVADECRTDALGNLICSLRGAGRGPTVLVEAHMDEVGVVVTRIEDDGRLYFSTVGFVDPKVLPGQGIELYNVRGERTGGGRVRAVVGAKPYVWQSDEEKGRPFSVEDLYLDAGCSSARDAEALGISVGMPGCFERRFRRLDAQGRVVGCALDDRAGLFVILEALRSLPRLKGTLEVAATAQEEVGLRGGRVIGDSSGADVSISVDVAVTTDLPGISSTNSLITLGGGPVVTVMDKGSIVDPQLAETVEACAREVGTGLQYLVTGGFRTNASEIGLSRGGTRAITLGIPVRYMHTPLEMVAVSDLEAVAELLAAVIRHLDNPTDGS